MPGSEIRKDYVIYERVEEIEENKINVVDLIGSQAGDYVKSDNGYYIPIIRVHEYRTYKHPNYIYINYVMPRLTYSIIKDLKTGKYTTSTFFYTFDQSMQKRKKLSAHQRLVARLMTKGVRIVDAVDQVYSTNCPSDIANKLIENDAFLDYLIEISDMKKLEESLEEAGLNYKFLAENIVKKIEDSQDLRFIELGLNLVNLAEKKSNQKEEPRLEHSDLSDKLLKEKQNL